MYQVMDGMKQSHIKLIQSYWTNSTSLDKSIDQFIPEARQLGCKPRNFCNMPAFIVSNHILLDKFDDFLTIITSLANCINDIAI